MKNGKLKIVTIGGGSTYTPELVEGFIKRASVLPVGELWLCDIDSGAKKLKIVGDFAKRMVKEAGVDIEVFTTLDREEALIDADFVTTQIRVGLLDAREKDESIPLKHGLLGQETNGAGGLFKALRTIPVILEIAEDIQRLCPNAWMINFSNPSGMVMEAMLKYSNHKRVIGLCNVPIHMERSVAKVMNVDPDRISILFAGLNHMVHGLKVYLDGVEITDKVIERLVDPNVTESLAISNIMPVDYQADFLRALGLIVCPYHNYYYKSDAMLHDELEELRKGNIRAQKVKQVEKELLELYSDQNLKTKPSQLEQRGGAFYSEAACRLIESIYLDKQDVQPVDVRNNGAIFGIDENSSVEVSCVITKEGPIPLTIGRLPVAVNGLVMQIKSFEILTVEAAVEGNYQKVLLALSINPLTPNDDIAKDVVDELLLAHEAYLPKFKDVIARIKKEKKQVLC